MESGTIVEFIDQQKIIIGAVLDVKQKRVRLLSEGNREVVLSEGRLLQTSRSRIETGKGREHILHTLKEINLKRETLKEKIDIHELWELLNEENEWIDLKTMSQRSSAPFSITGSISNSTISNSILIQRSRSNSS